MISHFKVLLFVLCCALCNKEDWCKKQLLLYLFMYFFILFRNALLFFPGVAHRLFCLILHQIVCASPKQFYDVAIDSLTFRCLLNHPKFKPWVTLQAHPAWQKYIWSTKRLHCSRPVHVSYCFSHQVLAQLAAAAALINQWKIR